MIVDFHVHSRFSHDSPAEPEEILYAAQAQGVDIVCVTDHVDLDFTGKDYSFDVQAREEFFASLREKFENAVELRLGVELGLQPHIAGENGAFVNSAHFDFVIGSTHLVDRMPFKPSIYPRFSRMHDKCEGVARFLENTLENIMSYDDYDVYGHLDYFSRYVYRELFDYSLHRELVEEILSQLVSRGKGIEINTGGYSSGMSNPGPEILNRYRELGGEIITMGSDAHRPREVGFCIRKGQELLKACGYEYFTVFKDRKPEFIKL